MRTSSEWEVLAFEALRLAFDENEKINKKASKEQLKIAKNLFRKSLSLKPTSAWPYIRLADLCDSNVEKAKLYFDSLKVESTVYAKVLLFDILLAEIPQDIYDYISTQE